MTDTPRPPGDQITPDDPLKDPRLASFLRRKAVLRAAVGRLVPRLRALFIVGGLMIVFGSLALASVTMSRLNSLVPVGIFMLIAGFLETGLGHVARTADRTAGSEPDPANGFFTAGIIHMIAGLVVAFGSFLPDHVHGMLTGIILMAAGVTWLRMGFAMPGRYQSAIIPLSGGLTAVIGILLMLGWGGRNPAAMGLLLSIELLVRGWAWTGFAVQLGKSTRRT
ncbi:MAG: hypothetical protein FJX29_04020 [Alphaproteobacteria bacterium]|nr:hypothetical protein [Alphaproteobacteria bacterium]